MASFSLELWGSLLESDTFVANIPVVTTRGRTGMLKWRHSTRSIGGNWEAEGYYTGPSVEEERFFLENLGLRIKVTEGGITWWEGQIVSMELTQGGQTWVRSMENLANWVSVIYSKVGDNLLTNGDVESGAWTVVGTPSTHAASTAWYARGTTSMRVVTDAANEGTRIQAAVGVTASTSYSCSVIVNVVSGTWTLNVLEAGTSNVIASRATTATGRTTLTCQIPDSNTLTSVDVQMTAAATGAEMYADGGVLRTSPVKSQTKWWTDTNSVTSYGRIEDILLEREMTDDEADGVAQKELADRAWPRTKPPQRGQTFLPDGVTERDGLIINCLGLVWTLAWRHALTEGSAQADTHVKALLDESQFVTSAAGMLDTNTVSVFLDSLNPTTLWDQIQKCIDAGNGSGTSWIGGLYPGRVFVFEARPTGTQYEHHRGRLRAYGGGTLPPLEFRPGWCWMTDMPTQPTPAAADASADDPRRVYLDETWYIRDGGDVQLKWTREGEA